MTKTMTKIRLETLIHARQEICFDLSRSLDLHQQSMRATNETAIAGKTNGLIERGEWVTWKAKHFGISQIMTIGIRKMLPYSFFEDVMIQGPFKSLRHLHIFADVDGVTRMTDIFEYEVPFGRIGKWFDRLVLEKYMTRLLERRNATIKEVAESETWKQLIPEPSYA